MALDPQPLQSPAVVRGTVVRGEQRGRELGFPTANVCVSGEDEVAYGVYAALVDGHPAAVSVGVRPTFGDGLEPLAEAHLIDFSGDLYGREIEIALVARIRDELPFESVEALKRQMADDVAAVRTVLAG